jgi:hypothetical protein
MTVRRSHISTWLGAALALVCLIVPHIARSTEWAPITNVDPTTAHDNWAPHPIISSDNTAWVIWMGIDDVQGDEEAYYSRWDGFSWSAKETINPPNSTPDRLPRAASSADGAIWAVWKVPMFDGTSAYAGLASHWNGAGWTPPDTIWIDGTRYNQVDIFAVSSTEAWFIRDGADGDVYVYHLNGGVRDSVRIDLPGAGAYQPGIAVDRAGVVWAAWTHQESYPTPERLEFTRKVLGVWSTPEIIPVPIETKLPQLTIDPDDVKWIVCAGDDPTKAYKGDDVWAIRWNGSSWEPMQISDEIQSNDSLQVYNAVSRIPGEYPRAVWVRANLHNYTRYDILISGWNGSAWSHPELVGQLADSMYSNWPDVASRNGRTLVAWMGGTEYPPYVFKALSVRSIPVSTAAFGAIFEAKAGPMSVDLAWSLSGSEGVRSIAVMRAIGKVDATAPPEASSLVLEVPEEQFGSGAFSELPPPGAGYVTYWLRVDLATTVVWIGPRPVYHSPPPPRSALTESVPNPTRSEILLRGVVGFDRPISVNIYGIDGRLVRVLPIPSSALGSPAGALFSLNWDGRGSTGDRMSNGVYLAQLVTGASASARRPLKIVLVR